MGDAMEIEEEEDAAETTTTTMGTTMGTIVVTTITTTITTTMVITMVITMEDSEIAAVEFTIVGHAEQVTTRCSQCRTPAMGHNYGATFRNRMNGNNANCYN